ncbi:M20/M25/M40 family metallo-hydrolase [Echinicola sp. CAU 1574]|uniref:M20/M25/M40 family metallo-hydrolase n=1 Tax=Echinicola arenosa TaxID=2774144 RepID=A0ABR9AF08_9BACT|nr:M28 family metallopeptidase [Echinicola arenosa]MBD8487395.1 M20/M25/M40 family metallo-hydrolase [Echinicola arenosa]
MKKILLLIVFLTPILAFSQTQTIHRNSDIAAMVQEISPDRLEEYINGLVSFGTRHSLSKDQEDCGIEAARQYVLSQFKSFEAESGGRLSAKIDYYTVEKDGRRIPEDVRMGNVMAILKGTNPNDDRIFVVSGHLDSRVSDVMNAESDAPGANDDGSGVAALIEMARIMSKRPYSATIIFVAVSGEEQGLKGATYMAQKAKAEGWNLAAMINNDMIGNSSSSGTSIKDNTRVRVFSEGVPLLETEEMEQLRRYTNGENDSKSRQLARYIKEIGERYVDQLEVKLVYRNDRFLRGGDHTPFSREGFTAVRMCEFNENYNQQHQDLRTENGIQYGDLPEHIDYEYLRKNTGVNLAVLASLASAPSVPQEVGIDVSQLSNSSTLKWKAPATGDVMGYYILMRETTSPVWEKKFFTQNTNLTLPYSKDNYFFAVQSVGGDFVESMAVFPHPIR